MKIRTFDDIKGFILSEFSGGTLQIATGAFGANQQFEIDQQDGALEISQNGKLLWSSAGGPHLRPKSISSDRPFTPDVTEILRRADAAAAERGLHFVDSIVLLLGMINGEGWEKSYAADLIAESGNVKIMRDRASSIAGTTGWKEARVAEESAIPEAKSTAAKSHAPAGLEITAKGAASLITQDTVPDAAPGAEELLDGRPFDDADETPDYRTFHHWRATDGVTRCKNCDELWTAHSANTCPGDVGARALTQLGGCLLAAEGQATGTPGGTPGATKGDYGWSPAFQAVRELWEKLEVANNRLVNIHGTVKKLEGYLLSGGRENERLEEKIRAQDKARAQMSAEYHDLVAGFKRSAEEVKELRVSLEAERTANADKVQTIYRQCQERRAIRTAALAGDMDRLRDILFPPESDEPESVEETEMKTVVLDAGPDHLKIVEIENVTALRAERDYLTRILRMCELVAEGRKIPSTFLGMRSEALQAVMTLREDRNWLRSTIAGLRDKVMAHLPCVCSQNRSICHRHEIEETLDDFERQAGVAEAEGPERDDDVTAPALKPEGEAPLFTQQHYDAIARAIAEAHLKRIQCGESRDIFNVKLYNQLISLFSVDNHNFNERHFNKACKVGGDE